MTIPINQNQNRMQVQISGLSSLNAAYLNGSNKANTNNQSASVSGMDNSFDKPYSAYANGLGTVPSGYFLHGDDNHSSENHIIKKTPLTGARIMADKLTKDIFLYAPKGLQGSKNSNFYEYLSLGIVPNIIGSAMLIATSSAVSKFFNPNSAKASKMTNSNVAMGVVMYAAMKWLGGKVMNKGFEAITGVDVEMPYKKIIHELPENGKERTTTEFHRVFESVDFPYWGMIDKQGEENGNRYEYYDKIAKNKLGCKEPLNAPDQVVQPLVKKALVKLTAAKSISSFLWAATGVAIAAQEPFSRVIPKKLPKILADSVKDLWKGKTKALGVAGKALIATTLASTVLGLANVKRGYKIDKESSKTKIDYTKDYMEN